MNKTPILSIRKFPQHFRQKIPIVSIIFGLFLLLFSIHGSAVPVPYGEPVYTATIIGDNELLPGNVTPITVIIRNTALAPEKIQDIEDPVLSSPTVAYGAELTLMPGSAPVEIPATPITIPVLLPHTETPVTFPVIVPANATGGSYTLDLHVRSQYAESVAKEGHSNVFTYADKNVTLRIPIVIKEIVRVRLDDISSTNLSTGQSGQIKATITNTGQYAGTHATAELLAPSHGLLSVFQGSYFLGTFEPGEQEIVEWKASVKDGTDSTSVPAILVISYEDKNGIQTTSYPLSIGIPVNSGPRFNLSYENPVIQPGTSTNVKVTYINTGDAAAHYATAKIVPVPPVSSPQTMVLLGTIPPGGKAEVSYEIALESSALVKSYGMLTDIKYHGENALVVISDPMYIEISATPPGILDQLLSPLSLVILLGLLLIVGYTYLKREGRLI